MTSSIDGEPVPRRSLRTAVANSLLALACVVGGADPSSAQARSALRVPVEIHDRFQPAQMSGAKRAGLAIAEASEPTRFEALAARVPPGPAAKVCARLGSADGRYEGDLEAHVPRRDTAIDLVISFASKVRKDVESALGERQPYLSALVTLRRQDDCQGEIVGILPAGWVKSDISSTDIAALLDQGPIVLFVNSGGADAEVVLPARKGAILPCVDVSALRQGGFNKSCLIPGQYRGDLKGAALKTFNASGGGRADYSKLPILQ